MAAEVAQDTAVIFTSLVEPGHGLARAVERNRALTAVLLATLLSLLGTGLILPRINQEAVAADRLQPEMTQHEREDATQTAVKLFKVQTWAVAAVGPLAQAFLVAFALWLGFRTAGARTAFKPTFTVTAHALVPLALRSLLTAPAAIAHAPVTPAQLYPQLARYRDPLEFVRREPIAREIDALRRADLAQARREAPWWEGEAGAVYLLADAPWSRRVIGSLANELAVAQPRRAHAVAKRDRRGALVVSVRAPLEAPAGADALCRRFGGAGRASAAGIDGLPENRLDEFVDAFASMRWDARPQAGAGGSTGGSDR